LSAISYPVGALNSHWLIKIQNEMCSENYTISENLPSINKQYHSTLTEIIIETKKSKNTVKLPHKKSY